MLTSYLQSSRDKLFKNMEPFNEFVYKIVFNYFETYICDNKLYIKYKDDKIIKNVLLFTSGLQNIGHKNNILIYELNLPNIYMFSSLEKKNQILLMLYSLFGFIKKKIGKDCCKKIMNYII